MENIAGREEKKREREIDRERERESITPNVEN